MVLNHASTVNALGPGMFCGADGTPLVPPNAVALSASPVIAPAVAAGVATGQRGGVDARPVGHGGAGRLTQPPVALGVVA